MVHTAVADAGLLHAADHLLKGVQILQRIAVHLHIADVAGVGESVIGGLLLDLLEGGDGEVDGDVEAVGVEVPVSDAGDLPKALLVHPHKPAAEALGGGGQKGEVEPRLGALLVHPGPHPGDDLQTQPLTARALAVVLSGEGS